jgi:hypothetical protein
MPAILYLPTAFLDGAWLWFDRLQYIFRQTAVQGADIAGLLPLPQTALDLSTAALREKEFQRIAPAAQWLPAAERNQLGDHLAELLRVHIPEHPTPEFAALRWEEVREMARHGIEFGGHTVNHPILQTLRTEKSLEDEIAGCKARIESELGQRVAHFAYPSGRANEVTPLAREVVRRAGFETAVSTELGQVRGGDDLYWLRRVGSEPGDDLSFFRRCLVSLRRS